MSVSPHGRRAVVRDAPDTNQEKRRLLYVKQTSQGSTAESLNNGWPKEAQRLRRWTWTSFLGLVWDIFITLTPALFLVFTGCALALNHQQISPFGSNIQRGTSFGPTVFPIVFAVIASRMMRAIALKRAETGSELGLLEQLIGSQSLGGTLERAVKLRRYNLIGIAVILLWLLSPLGGQSSLRILDIENRDVISSTQITYYNATARPQTSVLAGEGSSFADLKIVASLFQATLLESNRSRTSPVDLWNNVKIPRLRQLSPFTEAALDNEWISIDNNANIAWSSLTGLLIKGLPLDGISTFVISSTYLDLACSDDTPVTSLDDLANISTGTAVNLTNGAWNFETYSNYLTTEEVVTSSYMGESLSSDGHLPLSLTYVSDVSTLANSPTANSNAVDVYNCSLDLATVESNTTCHGDSCTVTSMKRSPDPSHSMPFSSLEYGQLLNDLCLLGGLVNGGKATAGGHCATDYYLLGETSPLSYVTQEDPPLPNFPSIKGPVFAERLTTLLNTAWQISLAPINLPLGSSANFSQITPDGGTGATDTTATVARQVPHYSTNMLYITLLLVVTFVLQACAIVGLILKYMTIAPDILGYVSTMTRDNPHTKIGVGGNTLDGLERARLLHSMKVQLADSTKDQAEGHVVFRSVDPEDEYAKKELDKRRLYF